MWFLGDYKVSQIFALFCEWNQQVFRPFFEITKSREEHSVNEVNKYECYVLMCPRCPFDVASQTSGGDSQDHRLCCTQCHKLFRSP